MNDQEQVNVCPRCGAVLNNGVCPGCGYEAPKQEEQIDSVIYNAPDVYQSLVEKDIYQSQGTEVVPRDTGGRFSGSQAGYSDYNNTQNNSGYNMTPYQSGNNGYGGSSTSYQSTGNMYGSGNPYQNTGNVYGNGNPYQNTGNMYGESGNPYQNIGNPYGGSGNPYQNTGNTYGGSNNPYQNTGNMYGSGNPYQNTGNMYGNGQFSNNANAYGGSQFSDAGNNYGKNPYQGNNVYGGNPYAPDYGYNNPYSPYAAPQKKKYTGLIVGIIITVVVLFFIALFALIYNAFNKLDEKEKNNNSYGSYYDDYYYNYDDDLYDYDPDYGYDYYYPDYGYGYDYDYDDNYGYGYDYDYDYDYDYNFDDDHDYDADEYYTLHNDDKKGLDYTIDWEYYDHETDKDNVAITVKYPVIVGDKIPNLDKLNETIADEVTVITNYYEEDYSKHMLDEDNYFIATSEGYITYMGEDVLSIAFSEYIYSDYYYAATLYCINIDMKDGVVMSNTGIIDVNDDFSVDFRKRSDKQNGTIEGLTLMTDQEITKYLTSEDNLIIFYTPQGLEVGFNYDDGWVTVTYKDYEDFLKIF